jgi:uncharacterized Zn finger protein
VTVIQGPWGDGPAGSGPAGSGPAESGAVPRPREGGGFYPRPRKVSGGIKARSKRGAIGEQWWSRRFIDVLESLGMQSRLTRGRNYARAGQVLSLDIGTGHVTAQVQGSRARPYKVILTVDPLTRPQWSRVEQALAARAVFRARLLAGEMPAEIEEIFADCGTPLFPRSARDLLMTCSCPDWGVPCKHVAAVCYVLAEAFDDDPFAMLAWRGKGRDQLLAALRSLSGAGTVQAAAKPGEVADRPLADSIAGFWASGLPAARLRALPPAAPAPPDLLLRGFEPPAIDVAGQDLVTLLRPAYEVMAGPELAAGTEPPPDADRGEDQSIRAD